MKYINSLRQDTSGEDGCYNITAMTHTNNVKSLDLRVRVLPCQDGSGNGFSQSDIQPAVNVCQDGRFGRGHADGKVGCQPREREVSLLTPVAEGLHR